MTKYVLVDAAMLDELLKKSPKALKPHVAAVKNSAKDVNPKAIELLGLINDFMERMDEMV
jgi:hypothetical protein